MKSSVRFIPTCVGNTRFRCIRRFSHTVHPHLRGEYTKVQKSTYLRDFYHGNPIIIHDTSVRISLHFHGKSLLVIRRVYHNRINIFRILFQLIPKSIPDICADTANENSRFEFYQPL